MNKRGQLFIIAAIIFVLALYSVVIHYNTIRTYPEPNDFKKHSEEYKTEYPKVYNWALYQGFDTDKAINTFTGAYLEQIRKADPNFGIFYIFKTEDGRLNIVNTLNRKALVIKLTNAKVEDLKMTVLADNTLAAGQICVEGLGCSTANAGVGDYYAGFANQKTAEGIETLCFEVPSDVEGEDPIIPETCLNPEDFKKFNSMTVMQSQEVTPTASQNINVVITQY